MIPKSNALNIELSIKRFKTNKNLHQMSKLSNKHYSQISEYFVKRIVNS